ncbi:NosR/NirI family protein [Rhodanobacter spathiphylli]|uniref:Regulatory protein NosR n=1 Tax=Rhodanobacter spathiphylli B39 TaxID=1163407 RepID=I4W3I6_9GAMM|nr:NosR/NirI family protein [Rhodanobacter spathiphylli]EIL94027.1 regulatory protein NosR [Rhodanobacter spathiphylli B39]
MRMPRPLVTRLLLALCLLLLAPAALAGIDAKHPQLHEVFPQATRYGDIEGTPPAAAVYQGDKIIGYVFETVMVAPVPAYSGAPINLLVSIGTDGSIRDARVLEQHEPILLVGIPVQKLYDFVARYIGHRVDDQIVVGGGASGSVRIDAISSATVTSMVVNETIMNSALKVAASRKLIAGATDTGARVAAVRADYYQPADWDTLTGNGAIGHLQLKRQAITDAFKGQPESGLVDDPTAPAPGHEGDVFIDLYFADVTPPTVGRNLLGASAHADLMRQLKPGDSAIAVMANGIYSFKGVGYVRGGIFDRVHVLQDGKLVLFKDTDLVQLNDTPLRGKPDFAEQAIFIVRNGGSGFDATRPWTLQLMVNRQVGPLQSIYHTFTRDYRMPAVYTTRPQSGAEAQSGALPADAALWQKIWYGRRIDIAVLLAGLTVLTLILLFQDWLVTRPVLLERVRTGFLIYTLVFIGWYGLAQLSVVNIFTFIQSLLHGFHWETFLMDPLIFILWVFVAATLLLLGRGVYCGWLCPFGALQVLVNNAAKRLHVPQFEFPRAVHERLWALKYVILLVLFGMSLQSLNTAEHYAEIEPFKTTFTLHFARSWSYVLYAVLLAGVSAFNHKFYCRYVCPLGAGLAVSGRWRLFEWLRRRPECGSPCQVCANECEVKAIHADGRIDFNECHYCLDCQVTRVNDHKCPPMVQQRKKRERAARPLPTPIALITPANAPETREPAPVAD